MLLIRRNLQINQIRKHSESLFKYLTEKIEADGVNSKYLTAIEKFSDKILFNSVLEVQSVRLKQLDDILSKKEKTQQAQLNKHVATLPVVLSQFCEPAAVEDEIEERDSDDESVPIASSFPFARYVSVGKQQTEQQKDNEIPNNWMQDYEFFDESNEDISTYGTPNPTIPVTEVPCGGCGALLHCKDPSIPGYLPSEIIKPLTKAQLTTVNCQRCHFLTNYNTAINVSVKPEDYINIISTIKDKHALAVILVDLLDFPCSFFPNLAEILGPKRPVVIVANKVDIMPRDHPDHLNHLTRCIESEADRLGFDRKFIKHIALISAKTGYGVEQLITRLQQIWGTKGDVYLIGCTNVGKSSLFNALLQSDYCKVQALDLVRRATTCPWPGTTLNMLKFPILKQADYRIWLRTQRLVQLRKLNAVEEMERRELAIKTKNTKYATLIGHIGKTFDRKMDEEKLDVVSMSQQGGYSGKIFTLNEKHKDYVDSKWCYDTPGVIQSDQILHLLTTDEIIKTLPKEMLKARVFLMKPKTSIFIAGLGRLDYIDGPERIRLIVFASLDLPVSIVETENADEFYKEFLGSEVLGVPFLESEERLRNWPKLEAGREFTVEGIEKHITCCDAVLSSAGWIGINLPGEINGTFKAWTPEKRGIYFRQPSLVPYGMQLRGKRVRGSVAYLIGDSFSFRKVKKSTNSRRFNYKN